MRTIRMTCFGFPDSLTVVLSDNFAGYSQYLYILLVNIKLFFRSLQNRPEKLVKRLLFYLFLNLVQINFIFNYNVNIYCIYNSCCWKAICLIFNSAIHTISACQVINFSQL